MKDADVFESVEVFIREYADLSHAIAMTLLKIRLLADLRALQASVPVGEKVPQEILDSIREQLVSPIVGRNTKLQQAVREGKSLTPYIKKIDSQIDELFRAIQSGNKHFWPTLLDPGTNLSARPDHYSSGTPQEMQLALRYNYQAWVETPGAVEVISAKLLR